MRVHAVALARYLAWAAVLVLVLALVVERIDPSLDTLHFAAGAALLAVGITLVGIRARPWGRRVLDPLVAGAVVVVGDLEGQVHFLGREDGRALLRLPTDGTPVVGTPVLAGTTVIVATRGGGLFAFRPQ